MNKPAYQSSYVEGIKEFNTIDLNGLSSIKLLNRHDTKFVMPIEILNDVLNELKNDYKALNIDDNLIGKYETQYYDSSDLSLYRIHQNGKKNRFKIRTRSYLNNNESFLEIKQKNNKNRTSKKRKKLDNCIPSDDQVIMSYVKKHVPDFSRELKKSLNIHFSRITLADKNLTERITIDLGLTYKRDMAEKSYPRLVIVEVKQDQYNHYSTIIKKLHERRIYPFRISKYCLGIYSLYSNDEVKKNMMKVKIRALEKCLGTI